MSRLPSDLDTYILGEPISLEEQPPADPADHDGPHCINCKTPMVCGQICGDCMVRFSDIAPVRRSVRARYFDILDEVA